MRYYLLILLLLLIKSIPVYSQKNKKKIIPLQNSTQEAIKHTVEKNNLIIDSLKCNNRPILDSLWHPDLAVDRYRSGIDSLRLKQEMKVFELSEKTGSKTEHWKSKLSVHDSLRVWGFELDPKVEEFETDIPSSLADGVKTDLNLPDKQTNPSIPELDNSEVKLPEIQLEELKELESEFSEIKTVPNEEIEQWERGIGAEKVKDQFHEIKEIGDELDVYKSEAERLKEKVSAEEIEERVGEEATKRIDVNELNEGVSAYNASKETHIAYLKDAEQYQNKETILRRIREKSKSLAVNHLPKDFDYQSKLESAQNRLAEHKKKYGELKSLKDTLKRKVNPLKIKGWKKRLTPGVNVEVLRFDRTSVDFSPYVGYRMSQRLSVYAGYVHRISFGRRDASTSVNEGHTYGGRLFSSFEVLKGFSAISLYEFVRTDVPRGSNESRKAWVNGVFSGIMKKYNLSRRVKGSIQLLYNFNHNEESSYPRKYNIRLGFELDFMKKRKKKGIL